MSQLGVFSREALLITADIWNSKGGIDGRRIDIVIADDQSDPDVGRIELNRLVDQGISVIIGPMTSNMTPAIKDLKNNEILIFSPTISTSELSGLDDNFIRLIPDAAVQGKILSELAVRDGVRTVVVVYDDSNPQYSEEVLEAFSRYFGITRAVISSLPFNGKSDFSAIELAVDAEKDDPDGIVFIASGIDTAQIIQILHRNRSDAVLYGSTWTKTTDLLENGGRTVESMKVVSEYIETNDTDGIFYREYLERTGVAPSFPAIYTHETAEILFNAISKAGIDDIDELKKIITDRAYEGLWETIRIDEFGDAYRTDAFAEIRNGRFVIQRLNE